jgi:hypothetical protein
MGSSNSKYITGRNDYGAHSLYKYRWQCDQGHRKLQHKQERQQWAQQYLQLAPPATARNTHYRKSLDTKLMTSQHRITYYHQETKRTIQDFKANIISRATSIVTAHEHQKTQWTDARIQALKGLADVLEPLLPLSTPYIIQDTPRKYVLIRESHESEDPD